MDKLQALAQAVIQWSALLLLFVAGLGLLIILVIYLIDKTQTTQTIRRNYPVVGRFRYAFEHMGEFFRQYFSTPHKIFVSFEYLERKSDFKVIGCLDN